MSVIGNDITLKVGFDISKFQTELTKANTSLTAWGKGVTNIASGIGIAFGASQVWRGVSYGVEVLAGFEQKMQEVRAVSGATAEQFLQLQNNARALGASTEYTATQIGGLQASFARLGFTTKEILNSTKAVTNLATATGSDLAGAAEIAGSTLRAFQLDTKEMGRVTDVMASSFNKSALQLDTFAESMKYVAPIAKAAGISIEQTTAYLSALADSGIKGSQAGTALRRIFGDLTKDGRPLAERLQELSAKGLSLADANDEVGRYAQTALLVLSSQNEKVKELTTTYENARGEATRTADIMRDTLAGDFKLLTSAIDGVIQKGTIFSDILRNISQSVTHLINSASGADKLNNLIERVGAFNGGTTQNIKELTDEIVKLGGVEITDASLKKLLGGDVEGLARTKKAIEDANRASIKFLTDEQLAEKAIQRQKEVELQLAQEKLKKDQESKQAQEEINQKYRDRIALIKQIEKNMAIDEAYQKEASKKVSTILTGKPTGYLSGEKNINLDGSTSMDKISSPFNVIDQKTIDANESFIKNYEKQTQKIARINNAIQNSFVSMATNVASAIGNAFAGGESIGQGLLKALASFGQAFGAQLIAIGIAESTLVETRSQGLKHILAGGALVAASSALATISARSSSGGGGGGYSNGGSYNQSQIGSGGGGRNAIEFKISGKDLVAVYNQAQADNGIRKG